MTLRQNAFIATTAAAVVLAVSPQAFAAVDGEAVFDALVKHAEKQGIQLTSESVDVDGDNVAISNLKITVPDGKDGFQMDKLLLEDVAEVPNGSYIIGRVGVPSYSMTKEGISVGFEGAAVEGFYLAGPNETDPILANGLYRNLEIGAVEVLANSRPVFNLEGVTSSISPYEPGGTLDIKGEVQDFTINFANMPEPKAQAVMAQIGYTELTGRGSATGTWDTSSGDLTFDETIELDDAATLNIEGAIGGYTAQLVDALQKLNVQMKDQSDEATGIAMLGLMQQLQVASLNVELVDHSLTGKLLDFAAKQQGTNRETIIAQGKGALPLVLMQLQNPEFAAKVSAAVGAYLDNPQSLKIAAAPASPVPVAQIVATAMSTPQALVSVLGLDITANE